MHWQLKIVGGKIAERCRNSHAPIPIVDMEIIAEYAFVASYKYNLGHPAFYFWVANPNPKRAIDVWHVNAPVVVKPSSLVI